MGRRVLVTRPRADGERTATRLADLGHAALLAPLAVVAPTDGPPPPEPFDALILTSANAAAALARLGGRVGRRPVFAVGARTAAAATAAGVAQVRAAEGDALALAALVRAALPTGATLLHVAGRDRKAEPATSLAAAGYRVLTWTAYEATAVSLLPAPIAAALRDGALDAALHYSRRSAALLVELAGAADRLPALLRLEHACLSADVAIPLQSTGADRLIVAPRPTEESLLTALDRRAPGRLPSNGSRREPTRC